MTVKNTKRIHIEILITSSIIWCHMGDFIVLLFPCVQQVFIVLYAYIVFEIRKKITLNVTNNLG